MGKGAEGARQLGCSLASDSEMATWTSLTGFLFYNGLPTIMMNWMTFLIIAILLVVFALFKERILLGLAGDRKFHGDVLSCMKGALGVACCSCGWKTWCAPCLGCCHCLELPFSHAGCCRCGGAATCQEAVLNFQDAVQKVLGLSPRTLIISKVVVGDLPLEEDGDFYFGIDCGVSPEQRSSVEESDGYAVQFADNMLCKVRDSHFEQPVNISIWRLHFMAPTKLCEVFLTPRVLFKLLRQTETWRIAMHVCDTSAPHAHPWICFELQEHNGTYIQNQYLTLPGSRASESSITAPLTCGVSCRSASIQNLTERHASFHEFKMQRENLYDQNMKKIIKTDNIDREDDPEAHRVANGRWMKRACLGAFFLLVFIMIPRFYIMSCYQQYQWMTVAESMDKASIEDSTLWGKKITTLRGSDALWTTAELHGLWTACSKDTLGLDDDTLQESHEILQYCRPSEKAVADTCLDDKSLQPKARAMKDIIDLLESNGGVGRAVVHQLRSMDDAIHSSFPKSTPQYLFTGGFECPCSIVEFRDMKVLGLIPLHVIVDCVIWSLAIAILVLRCWCMPHRLCGIRGLPSV